MTSVMFVGVLMMMPMTSMMVMSGCGYDFRAFIFHQLLQLSSMMVFVVGCVGVGIFQDPLRLTAFMTMRVAFFVVLM